MFGGMTSRPIAAILLLLLLAGAASAQSSKPAAIVNGEAIPMSEIDAVLATRPAELIPLPEAQKRLFRQEILERLIAEKLMNQFLAKYGPAIAPKEVQKQLDALTESQKANGKTLADYCKETHQSEAQLRANIQSMLQFFEYAQKQASESELKKYYQNNLDYFHKVTVRCSHIVLRLPTSSTEMERQAARQKLLELRQQILDGKVAFADAARAHSQCPSAPKGGDIGYITRKWMVEEPVAQPAFALKKGDLSAIVETEYGLHLLLVTDRTMPQAVPFETCIDDVRDCCIEEMRQKLLIDLRKAARIEIKIQ
jgi:peptidyl-prolyl cis-trans isomerase C